MSIRLINIFVKINGLGVYIPSKHLSNRDVIRRGRLKTTDSWIREHAGIAERRALGRGETNFTMAVRAARRAIKNAHSSKEQIGLVVVGSETAGQYLPATASLVRDELGLKGASAMDVNTACASFMTAFVQAALFLEFSTDVIARSKTTKQSRYSPCRNEIATLPTVDRNDSCALVIGVDSLFEHQDPRDRDSSIIFGDGAGAVVVSCQRVKHTPSPDGTVGGNIKEIVLSSVPGKSAITNPLNGYFKMDRKKVRENILELITSNLSVEKCKRIDHFFFHQASKRMLDDIAGALKIPIKKIYSTLWRYGNTGAASIPITLDRAVRSNKIKEGDHVLLCGFGAGYEYVHVIMQW